MITRRFIIVMVAESDMPSCQNLNLRVRLSRHGPAGHAGGAAAGHRDGHSATGTSS